MKKFFLSKNDRVIGGVCGGIATYLDMDATFIRIIFALLLFGAFPIFLPYLITWALAPVENLSA